MNFKKRIFTVLLSLITMLFSVVSLSSCSKIKKRQITLFDYFNTFATLTVYTDNENAFQKYKNIFESTLSDYHTLLDSTDASEKIVNLYYLNQHAAAAPVKVSEEMIDFIIFAKEMYAKTNRYTNIALGSVTVLWKSAITAANNGAPYLPSESKLIEALRHTDAKNIHINKETLEVSFSDEHLKLDAGALAKGYVSKILYDKLIDSGCESFLINLGGNISAHGLKNNSSPWLGEIENPTNVKNLENISIELTDRSISTSGSYNQFFILDGVRYHHIINPYTAHQENEFVSVSVITSDIASADALSTALFSMSREEGIRLVDSLDETEAVWITADGEFFSTAGFDNYTHK